MQKYKNDTIFSALSGEYRKAVEARRKYASMAVDNFELAIKLQPPIRGSIPLFSKIGFNLFKYMIYNLFVKTTPEEKKLKTMSELYKKGKLNITR